MREEEREGDDNDEDQRLEGKSKLVQCVHLRVGIQREAYQSDGRPCGELESVLESHGVKVIILAKFFVNRLCVWR